jgi:hypothetical protein
MSVIFDDEKPEAYHWRMNTEKRIDKLEVDDESHKATLAYLQANCATKDDILRLNLLITETENRMLVNFAELKGEVKAQITEARASIIQWVVTAVFIAQLLPALLKLFIPG